MKKLIFLFVLLCALFTGCSSDKDYINALKEIPVENILSSRTTEEMAVNFMRVVTKTENIQASDLKWKVDGNTKIGKVVTAEYQGNKIYFNTFENGDYVEYVPLETYMITSENQTVTVPQAMYSGVVNLLMDALNNQE